ncbi:hypothetical protein P280DRAFT_467896 [Massarina eburnea CBS 473.64]|uniref:DUF7730 domain-containing protein n=1 Tax=Massarina eburnea CBS 473.64 TaxID=1395130 RepID=A0A6A6S4M7_9PLEO|nr:hypothetical protein P280DRAFT_467896 [Massarina eburnea CBS 473.64]
MAGDGQQTRLPTKRRASSVDSAPVLKKTRTDHSTEIGLPTPEASTLTEESEHIETETPPIGPFDFMGLPAELRIAIYRMALWRAEPILLHHTPPAASIEKPDTAGFLPQLRRCRRPSDVIDTVISSDPINVALLRANKQIYQEARRILYADNTFILSLESGVSSLASLHQRNRSLIKNITLTIPSHHDILDGFADLVRLGLRYCWGLKTFTIVLDLMFPDGPELQAGTGTGMGTVRMAAACSPTTVYANAFHILRWLPRACKVGLRGHVSEIVRRVVAEEGRLLESLDEVCVVFEDLGLVEVNSKR